MEMNEMLVKAKKAKTPEELLAIANENGVELDEEGAKAYFEQLHQSTGELSDDELDEVSGGGCGTPKDDRMVVTPKTSCYHFSCKVDEWPRGTDMSKISSGTLYFYCVKCYKPAYCANCRYMVYENGKNRCNHPGNRGL